MGIMNKILLIEDDQSINKILAYELSKKGYQVDSLFDGKEAVQTILKNDYDLVLVDWMLPYQNGVSIIKEVRSNDYVKPLILLTARSEQKEIFKVHKIEQEDIIKGLEAGADDYLTKPFQSAVLIARIEAHLRRHHKHFLDEIKFGDVLMNTTNREVMIQDQKIVLTKVEYDLLKMFLEHPREAVSRETLLQSIWGFQYDGDTRIVDVHVFKLKGKLKESRVSFKSVRGVGYKLVKKDD